MFDTLPVTALDALDWPAERYQPYYDDLLNRPFDAHGVDAWLADWSRLAALLDEVASRLSVATTVDTTDTEAEARYMAFYEHVHPMILRNTDALNARLVNSGLNPAGFDIPLRNIRVDLELFAEANLPLFSAERALILDYDRIKGAQTVIWDSQELTISQTQPLLQEHDRATRERAWRLAMGRQLEDRAALNDLWRELLRLRVQIAANAGLSDYRQYAWKTHKRFDYTPEDCIAFHEAIEAVVVPAVSRLHQRRRARLGIEVLRPWDLNVDASYLPPLRPFETDDQLQAGLETIFARVDPILGQYFGTMRAEGLLDLPNRKGKAPGGYCTTLMVAGRPFIFMNTVGLHDDVQTLLHEGGHAFHVFETNALPYAHQRESPIEFAEVASMSMEMLGGPYLDRANGGFYTPAEAARARIEYLEGVLTFWPYMAVVDAFQHWAYTHPSEAADPARCDAQWGALWDRFMPERDVSYAGLEAEKVTGWHRKLHIFESPFYYVEYGLAQLGATQVWANAIADPQAAVAAYRRALALGGTATLPQLFAAAGARFAFDAATLQTAVTLIETTLETLEAGLTSA